MADFSIGTFNFISLSEPPDRPREEPIVIARAGVANVAVYLTGSRTEPFQLASVVDIKASSGSDHVGAAVAEFRLYEAAIGGAPVAIKWNNVVQPGTFIVLGVSNKNIRPAMTPVGGLVGGGAVLRAVWTLVAVT